MPFSKIRSLIIILAIAIFTGGVGYQMGLRHVRVAVTTDKQVVVNQTAPASVNVDFSLFWEVWSRLFRYYIDAANLDAKKMVYGAIGGMVNSLGDPYTVFLPPKENEEFKQDLGGEFGGIGAQLGMEDGHVIIVAPLKGSPAEKAGIRTGDFIIKVDGVDTVGWTVPEAVSKIRGPKDTSVILNILHRKEQKPIDVTILRDTIKVPSVETWEKTASDIKEIQGVAGIGKIDVLPGKVAYLRLSRFGDHSNEDWTHAVDEIMAAQKTNGSLKGMVLDLRNNPGGYLESAVFIGSEFIKGGTVVSQVNSDGTKQSYTVARQGRLLDIPLIVLVNRGSASAAEIVAGALKDYKRAKLVGEVTFGKGSVQTPQELPGGAGIHITTGKWLTPGGETIHKKGITPDFIIKMEDADATSDAQLAKAVELLLK